MNFLPHPLNSLSGHKHGSVLIYTWDGSKWIRDGVINHQGKYGENSGKTFGDIVKINKDACISNRAAPITLTILSPTLGTHVYTHELLNEESATCAPTASPTS